MTSKKYAIYIIFLSIILISPLVIGLDIEITNKESSVTIELMESPWPMKCFDTHHTSRSPYSTSHIDGFEKWRYFCKDGGVNGGIVIDDEGNIYFGDTDRYIHSLNHNSLIQNYLKDRQKGFKLSWLKKITPQGMRGDWF